MTEALGLAPVLPDPKRAKCFDKDWRYTPANSTDIAATFKRVRRQLKEVQAAKEAEAAAKQAKKTADAKSARAKEKA